MTLHDGQQLNSGGRVDIVDGKAIVFMPITKSELAWAYRAPRNILEETIELVLPQEVIQGEENA